MNYQFSPDLKLPCPVCGCRSREAIRDNRVCVGVTVYPPPGHKDFIKTETIGLASLTIDDKDQTPRVCCSWSEGVCCLETAQRMVDRYTTEDIRSDNYDRRAMAHEYDDSDHGPPDSDPYDREPLQF